MTTSTAAGRLSGLRCPECGSDAALMWTPNRGECRCGHIIVVDDECVHYTPPETLDQIPEVRTRDREAAGYLSHAKFPTQISRVRQFLDGMPPVHDGEPAYDLGCGPGPYTAMLAARGYAVVAVDFSGRSLAINQRSLQPSRRGAVTYVRADLNQLRMAPESTGLLMMCDFLQHLGDRTVRDAFLRKACGWLRPGGKLYLTFFNFNVKNYLKGDLHGTFGNGGIPYERLLYRDVISALPAGISVDAVTPLNILTGAMTDRVASKVPGAMLLSRMVAVAGSKA